AGHGVEVDAARVLRIVGKLRPIFQARRIEVRGAAAIQMEMRMARGGAIRNHSDGEIRGVGRIVADFDVEDGGKSAEALSTNAELIHFVVKLNAKFFGASLRAARDQLLDVDRVHE